VRLNRRPSITLRLTVLFASASTVVLLILGALIGSAVEEHFEEQDMAILSSKLALTRHVLAKVLSEPDYAAVPQQLDDLLAGNSGLAVVVKAPGGETLFASSGAEFPHALLATPITGASAQPMLWRTAQNKPFRGIAAHLPSGIKAAPPALVGVATDISHHEEFMASFRTTLWSFVVLAAAVTGFLGWLAVRQGLLPLQAMKSKAESITAQRLDARLDVAAVPLELAALAQTLNAMLTRLEESFRRLSDFSSDLAHEFRTPVSNLLTQTQFTLSRPRSADDYHEVLASNVEEFERLSRMISDMLFIAKADEGQIIPSREKLDLAPLLGDLFDFHRLAADERQVTLSCRGEGECFADPLMLRRAISNLLANAIRHAPPGGQVNMAIQPHGAGGVVIAVSNSGEAIPAEHLPRLFDRFYRVDPSRTGEGTQSGLGLAIVKSIVEAHGGQVAVSSQPGETCFSLLLTSARSD